MHKRGELVKGYLETFKVIAKKEQVRELEY